MSSCLLSFDLDHLKHLDLGILTIRDVMRDLSKQIHAFNTMDLLRIEKMCEYLISSERYEEDIQMRLKVRWTSLETFRDYMLFPVNLTASEVCHQLQSLPFPIFRFWYTQLITHEKANCISNRASVIATLEKQRFDSVEHYLSVLRHPMQWYPLISEILPPALIKDLWTIVIQYLL